MGRPFLLGCLIFATYSYFLPKESTIKCESPLALQDLGRAFEDMTKLSHIGNIGKLGCANSKMIALTVT